MKPSHVASRSRRSRRNLKFFRLKRIRIPAHLRRSRRRRKPGRYFPVRGHFRYLFVKL